MTTLRSGQPTVTAVRATRPGAFADLSDAPAAVPGYAVAFDSGGDLAAVAIAGKAAVIPATGGVAGDIVWNSAPASGQPIGWMCTAPDTWKSMGNLG